MSAGPGYQFGRSTSLIVANKALGIARELSQLHFIFTVRASDVETPNTAEIRIYNLAPATVNEILKEYTSVILQVGYGQQVAQLFVGTIKQFKRGKERNVDSYLEILAADTDELYNFGFVNQSIAGPSTYEQRFNAICTALGAPKDPNAGGYLGATGGILPRGKVLFGLGRAYLRELSRSAGVRWSFQNGVLTLIPLSGYLPGDPVVINSQTGLIGTPEATDQGVMVTCLLNPLIKVGQSIQLSSADIQQVAIREQGYPNYSSVNYVANVTPGLGTYRVIVAEHEGDTRANAPWYSHLTCLQIDPTATTEKVLAYSTE